LDDLSLFFYLTDKHGGSINVESVDKGSRSTVSLPWQDRDNRVPSTGQILLAYQKAYLQQKHEHKEQTLTWIEKAADMTLNDFLKSGGKIQQKSELKERMLSWIEKEEITIPGYSYLRLLPCQNTWHRSLFCRNLARRQSGYH
jgi:hypothetical protein